MNRLAAGQRVAGLSERRSGFSRMLLYSDRAGDQETRKKKAASKTRYSCPACELNVWGKPGINVKCGDCDETMEAE